VETVLKGVVRAERLSNPQDYVAPILDRVSKEHIVKKYGVKEWTSDYDFVCQLALLKGKLMKGGEPDCDGIAKIMIYDWQRVRRACCRIQPLLLHPSDILHTLSPYSSIHCRASYLFSCPLLDPKSLTGQVWQGGTATRTTWMRAREAWRWTRRRKRKRRRMLRRRWKRRRRRWWWSRLKSRRDPSGKQHLQETNPRYVF
jgi:hypothetical protein